MTDPNKDTDPRQIPGADPHTGNRKVDPVTGYELTGHDWGGITELNTAFPRIVIWALVLTFTYSVIVWILLPAWPLGRDYTPGLLGLDQGEQAMARQRGLAEIRQDWLARFDDADFDSLAADGALMAQAMPAARRLFDDNCAACHGTEGQGGPGFPSLADGSWLWDGAPEEIAVTLRHGINTDDPDTRFAEMPAFDWMSTEERTTLTEFVAALPHTGWQPDSPAASLFADNCASCHGDFAEGGLGLGAPSLVDDAVIYGQDPQTVAHTLRYGRAGVMPAWAGRLTEAEINLLALYVRNLSADDSEAGQ